MDFGQIRSYGLYLGQSFMDRALWNSDEAGMTLCVAIWEHQQMIKGRLNNQLIKFLQ